MAFVPSLQTKVEEMTYRAMVADEVKGLGKRSDDIIEHVVFTGELKDLIVSLHNQLRADVKPPATDMQTMVRSPVDTGIRQQF